MRLFIILSLLVSIICASERDEIKSSNNKNKHIVEFNLDKYNLMYQTEDSIDAGRQTYSKKRGIHAALMSAAIPGLGELYAKSYWRAALFLAADVALLSTYVVYDGKGEDEDVKMRAFGDENWEPIKYWSKVYDEALQSTLWEGTPLDRNGYLISESDYNNPAIMRQLRDLESEVGYTHTLPSTKTQQYYEMIYKYLHQFGVGWNDIEELTNGNEDAAWVFYDAHDNLGTLSPNIKKYRSMRNRSNDYFQTATTMLNLMLLNHVLSALDAAFAVKQFNKKVNYSVRVNSQFDGIDHVTTYGLNVSW